jgi:hypothetical protein
VRCPGRFVTVPLLLAFHVVGVQGVVVPQLGLGSGRGHSWGELGGYPDGL